MAWDGARRALMALAGLAGLVGVFAMIADAGGVHAPGGGGDAADHLRDQVTVLRHRTTMARQGRLLLLLDPADSTLTLFLGGAELRRWRVYDVEAGARRFALAPRTEDQEWRTRLWQNPRLDPPVQRERRLIVSDSVVPPDPSGAVDWIPLMPEEAVPTPPRFVAHYTGGLGLEVVAEGPDSLLSKGSLVDQVAAGLRRLRPTNLDPYRIRIHMAAPEAGALYRSFPAEAVLVALIPGGRR